MKKIIYSFINTSLLSGCSNYNPLSVRIACRSKEKARKVFEQNNLPYAKGEVFINPYKAIKFTKKYGFPVVIKPNVGGFSRGAYFPIKNNLSLLYAAINVKKYWHSSIIEKFLLGKNYRIVVTKWGVMSIIRRYPPFVIGDGKSTIGSLIDTENLFRKKMQLLPTTQFIKKNTTTKKHLKKLKLNFNDVPTIKQKIYLHHKIALTLGSSVKVINKSLLSKNNTNDLIKILQAFNANILGIDVICTKGIHLDFNKQNSIFLEVNSRPFLAMYDNPRYGKTEDLSYFYKKLSTISINDKDIY